MNWQSITVPSIVCGGKNVSVLLGSVVKSLLILYPVPLILFTQLASKFDDFKSVSLIQSFFLISSSHAINLIAC